MSSFEFLSVFISVIVGLAMANMLTGGVNLIHRRHTVKISLAYAARTLWVFFLMVVYWWTVVFGWKDWENWNVLLFLFLLLYGIMLFLLSALLYPSEIPEPWDSDEHFLEIRRWFFGIEITWILLEFTDTHLKDHFDDFSVTYFFLMGGWLLCAMWGWVSAHKKTQAFIAIYHLATVVAWIVYQLWDLEWKGAAGG